MGQLVGAYTSNLFEGPSSKLCKAPLKVIHVEVRRLDCVEFRALDCS